MRAYIFLHIRAFIKVKNAIIGILISAIMEIIRFTKFYALFKLADVNLMGT